MKAKTVFPLLLAGVLLATVSPAQQPVRTIYRPWRLFWGDTSAYMEANWGEKYIPCLPGRTALERVFQGI